MRGDGSPAFCPPLRGTNASVADSKSLRAEAAIVRVSPARGKQACPPVARPVALAPSMDLALNVVP